jgi:ADP-ribose pyrophosphatase YjhB (NUDIX family)
MVRIVTEKPRVVPTGKVEDTQAARAIIAMGGMVLLCRGISENFCHMPGGHIDPREKPEVALHREIKEEMGRFMTAFALVAETDHEFVREYDGTLERQHSYVYRVNLLPLINEQCQQSKESHLTYQWYMINELWTANLQPPLMVPIIEQFAGLVL